MATNKLWIAVLASFLVHLSDAQDWPCTALPNGERIPHNFDCSLYFVCENGYKVVEACPYGTYFDELTRLCDEPVPQTGCVADNGVTICHGGANEVYPDPTDCSKYLECYQGSYHELQCPGGLLFDKNTASCADPRLVSCDTTTPVNPPQDTTCLGVSAGHTVLREIPGYCAYFYECVGTSYTIGSCPAGMYFHPDREMCDFEAYVTCSNSLPGVPGDSPVSPPPTITASSDPRCATLTYALLPLPALCDHYIHCDHFQAYEVACPAGTYFSATLENCVSPYLSGCGNVTPSPPPVAPPDGTQSVDCPYPIADGRLLPFPGDCTKYYECADGIKVEMDCPANLWWHQEIGECDYPYLTRCI